MPAEDPDLRAGRHPWDQRSNETSAAWSAFRLYRDMGPRRRLRSVAAEYYGVEEGAKGFESKMRQTEFWSAGHHWPDRVRAWDEHIARVFDAEVEALAAQQAGTHLRLADKMVEKAMQRLETLDPVKDLTNRDMVELLKVGTNLARQAAGEPTVITRQDVNVKTAAEEDAIAAAIQRDPKVALVAGELYSLLHSDDPDDVTR